MVKDYGDQDQPSASPTGHPAAPHWFGLLRDGFDAGHDLKRSSAASQALIELRVCATTGLQRGFPEAVALNFVPTVKDIHSTCMAAARDPYHRVLASQTVEAMLRMWWTASEVRPWLAGVFDPHRQMAEAVKWMAVSHFAVFKDPDGTGTDIISELTLKTARDKPTLQDIFVSVLWRDNKEGWQLASSVNDLVKLTELIGELTVASKESGVWNAEFLCAALYEIGYCCLFKSPPQYRANSTTGTEAQWRGSLRMSPERQLIESLFAAWASVARTAGAGDRGLEWHQSLVGLLGLGMIRYDDQPAPWLRSSLEIAVGAYRDAVKSAPRPVGPIEDPWSYLQLIGAWCARFLSSDELASEIRQLIAERSDRVGPQMGGWRGNYTRLGYPAVGMGEDFFLPWLRNLQPAEYLSDEDWSRFREMQVRLMGDKMLVAFYQDLRKAMGGEE